MSDIFISYSSSDRSRARDLAKALEREGWSVWWDRTIPPGKSFSVVLEEALEAARCVVVLWSPASAASDWVQTEAAEGKRRDILVPAMIEMTELPLEFKRIQAANLVDWPEQTPDMEYDQFLQAIQAVLGSEQKAPTNTHSAEIAAPRTKEKQVSNKPTVKWPKGSGARMALLTLISGAVLVGLFKALFPQTPVSEAVTAIALLSLVCAAVLNLGWGYFKRKG